MPYNDFDRQANKARNQRIRNASNRIGQWLEAQQDCGQLFFGVGVVLISKGNTSVRVLRDREGQSNHALARPVIDRTDVFHGQEIGATNPGDLDAANQATPPATSRQRPESPIPSRDGAKFEGRLAAVVSGYHARQEALRVTRPVGALESLPLNLNATMFAPSLPLLRFGSEQCPVFTSATISAHDTAEPPRSLSAADQGRVADAVGQTRWERNLARKQKVAAAVTAIKEMFKKVKRKLREPFCRRKPGKDDKA